MNFDPDTVQPAQGYAGDVSPQLACRWWQSGQAVLVDVRTEAELAWVGFVPGAVHVPWKLWPGMALNPDFDTALRAVVPAGKKVVMLCRSGVRSILRHPPGRPRVHGGRRAGAPASGANCSRAMRSPWIPGPGKQE